MEQKDGENGIVGEFISDYIRAVIEMYHDTLLGIINSLTTICIFVAFMVCNLRSCMTVTPVSLSPLSLL